MRRRRNVDPDAARRLARQSLTRLARLRDTTAADIHEAAQAAYACGLTYAEVGEALGMTHGTLPYGSETSPYGNRVRAETKKGPDSVASTGRAATTAVKERKMPIPLCPKRATDAGSLPALPGSC